MQICRNLKEVQYKDVKRELLGDSRPMLLEICDDWNIVINHIVTYWIGVSHHIRNRSDYTSYQKNKYYEIFANIHGNRVHN